MGQLSLIKLSSTHVNDRQNTIIVITC